MKTLSLLFALGCTLLAGCAQDNLQYRGVPSQTWQSLTAEQRQLIIDCALRDALNPRALEEKTS